MSIQGFWGLACESEKTYSQIVTAPFRIAMASLTDEVDDNKRTCVTVNVDKKEFILCTLIPNKIEQQTLDITFVEGEEVTFSVKGNNTVHLTGNYIFTDDDEDIASVSDEDDEEIMSPDDDDEEEFDEAELMNSLPAGITPEQFKAMIAQATEEDASSDEEIVSAEEMEDTEEEEEEEEEDKISESAANKKRAAPPVKEQVNKKQKQVPKEPKKKEEPKKVEPKKKEEPKKKITKLPNGLIVEDIKVGEGASCKSGQRVSMRYIGKLTTGKVFDKNVSGKPFSFLLGRGEVIKGWDIGVAGMKIGGERKLTIPAPLAYGKRGAPPSIPKNATLVFDIKLVSMK